MLPCTNTETDDFYVVGYNKLTRVLFLFNQLIYDLVNVSWALFEYLNVQNAISGHRRIKKNHYLKKLHSKIVFLKHTSNLNG